MREYILKFSNMCVLFCIVLSLILIFSGQNDIYAAAKNKKDEKVEEGPVTVLADYIHYDNVSGDIFAEGNVRILRGDQTLSADRMDGNVNTGDIWTKTKTRFEETTSHSDFVSDSAEYNYNTKTGNLYNVSGKTGTQYVTFDTAEILPEKIVGQNAMMTRCNAQEHTKCQHTTATRVDIWPNDRLIAYNANVYILGKKIYHQDRYVTSLGDDANKQIPRVGYNDDHGVYIKHTIAYPLGNKTSIGADLMAATSLGGRTKGWLRHNETNFSTQYSYGYFEDSDNEWIKKEHNIRINYHQKHLFKTPLKYRFWFERGHWKDKYRRSWHTEAGAYLTHDQLYLGSKSTYLILGTGYRKLKESHGDIEKDEYRYDATLYKIFSPKYSVSARYSDIRNNYDLFDYDSVKVDKSVTYTMNIKFDRMNKVSLSQQYDLDRNRVYKNRIEYTRNLHCWEIVFSYQRERYHDGRAYDNKFNWELNLAI